ncbi:MAG: NTP transferase domain-containing protein [Gemmatimonadota bacterium]|nr:NTP transferase domain-containing protein [Gemmatimonadota bacterium]MDH3368908.1 NTP transferase domain-containing protein [Gemmatimonadota bacterium]MDH3479980.1 NTP transferase domain-containing protein [Gemmatimonadota bacterium]MDH5551028.1 NTP transferase domain-containing protein [Gemmatimonadota bacterium]
MSMTLVILAAGRGSRYGGLKQLEPVGPHEATLMDYTIHDAVRAGVDRVVLVIPHGLDAVFLSHLGEQFGRQIDIRCIAQTIEAVPYGYSIPPERAKPWGTAHAVLITAPLVDGPFLVANADDFYGASSYALLCTHLREHPNVAAVVGYPLHATLSPHGGVSRGICELDPNGFVARVREVRHIRDVQGVLEGRTEAGDRLTLSGNETVSMNLWGFGSAILPILESDFARFLETDGADPAAEFLLPSVANRHIAAGSLRLTVLPSDAAWFGMTFPEDTPRVRRQIAELVAAGRYPRHLGDGLG